MKSELSKKVTLLVFILFTCLGEVAAQGDQIDQGGKIYAVVACVAIILIGIVAFLFYLERRISKIELQEDLH